MVDVGVTVGVMVTVALGVSVGVVVGVSASVGGRFSKCGRITNSVWLVLSSLVVLLNA